MVHGQRQFGNPRGSLRIRYSCIQASPRALEASPEVEMLVGVPELAEQFHNFVRMPARRTNDTVSRVQVHLASLHIFEQQAFELAAVSGAVRIDLAAAAIQGGARLGKFWILDFGFWIGG